MMRILLLLAFVFSAMDISAQTARGTRSSGAVAQSESSKAIVPVEQFLNGLSAKSANAHVRSLLYDANDATYVESKNVKTYGDTPTCLFTDVKSFAGLGSLTLPQTIEIITIKFKDASDFTRPLDLSVLSAFPKLQYVYLVSEVKVADPKMVSAVQNADPRYSVFYNIDTLR